MILPFGLSTSKNPAPTSGPYKTSGDLATHVAVVEIAEELILVFALSAMAASGGNSAKIATVLMVGIVVAWLISNVNNLIGLP